MFHYVEQQRVFINYDERKSIGCPQVYYLFIKEESVNVAKICNVHHPKCVAKTISAPDVENRTNNPDTLTAELLETGDEVFHQVHM